MEEKCRQTCRRFMGRLTRARIVGWACLIIGLCGLIPGCIPNPPVPWLVALHRRCSPTLFGLGLTVLIINRANEHREDRLLKERLKREMASTDNRGALRALNELEWHGGLRQSELVGADLRQARLQGAPLLGLDLDHADLSKASLQEADLEASSLREARLVGSDLRRARLWAANLGRATLWEAQLQEAYLWSANLNGANLGEANLQGADLLGADMRDALLRRAQIDGANLQQANLEGALSWSWDQLAECDRLRGARMPNGLLYDGRLRLPGDIYNAHKAGVELSDTTAMSNWYGVKLNRYESGQMWALEHGLLRDEEESFGYEVKIGRSGPMVAATLRRCLRTYRQVSELFADVYACLWRQDLSPLFHVAIYRDKEYPKRGIKMEAAVPVPEGAAHSEDPVMIRRIPGIERAASVVHEGSLDKLGRAHAALRLWARTQDYGIAGPIRDAYEIGPGSDQLPSRYVTKVYFPIAES